MQGRREASGVYLLCDLAQNYENLGGGRAKVEFGNLVTVENANQPSDLTRTLAGFSMMPATFLRPLLFQGLRRHPLAFDAECVNRKCP